VALADLPVEVIAQIGDCGPDAVAAALLGYVLARELVPGLAQHHDAPEPPRDRGLQGGRIVSGPRVDLDDVGELPCADHEAALLAVLPDRIAEDTQRARATIGAEIELELGDHAVVEGGVAQYVRMGEPEHQAQPSEPSRGPRTRAGS
jgi:hypothetical protein